MPPLPLPTLASTSPPKVRGGGGRSVASNIHGIGGGRGSHARTAHPPSPYHLGMNLPRYWDMEQDQGEVRFGVGMDEPSFLAWVEGLYTC